MNIHFYSPRPTAQKAGGCDFFAPAGPFGARKTGYLSRRKLGCSAVAIDIGKGVKVTAVLLVSGPGTWTAFFSHTQSASAPFMALFARPDFTATVEHTRASNWRARRFL